MALRKVRLFVGILVVYLVLGFLSWSIFSILMRTDLLKVSTIEITGINRLDEELVVAMGGVNPGVNIFSIRPWEIERRIERIPEVRKARVKKIFPRSVTIHIEERTPYALLVIADTGYCVDIDGVEIPCLPEEREELPRLWMDSYDTRWLLDGLEQMRLWKPDFTTPLLGIRVEDDRLFILKLQNDIFIRSEGPQNLREKSDLLRPLLREVQVKALQVGGFDLRMQRDIVLIRSEGEVD